MIAGGGRLAELSPAARECLQVHLPDAEPARNPLSLGATAGTRLAEAAACLAAVPEVDAVVAMRAPTPHGDGAAEAEAMIAAASRAARADRSRPGRLDRTADGGAATRAMARAGLAVFATPESAVRGALHLAQDRRNRAAAAELPARDVLDLEPDRARVRGIFDRVRADRRLALDDEEALAVLSAYGLPTVPGRRAAGPAEAADAAAMLRFPVVLKILSPDLQHKSEVGGVVLGLRSARAVRQTAEAMLERVRTLRPDAKTSGFLVQRQAIRALELRLRLGDDPMFGPWIGFGQGGTAADIAEDEAYDLPPLNLALASQLIGRSRAGRLLAGFRDLPPAEPGRRRRGAGAIVADRGGLARDRGVLGQPAHRRRAGRARARRVLHPAAGGREGCARHPALSGGAGAALHDARPARRCSCARSGRRTPRRTPKPSAGSRPRTSAGASSPPSGSCRRP